MISNESLKQISSIFCGDVPEFYTYKQGYKLVEFFNSHFGYKDVYGSGFPSRWSYVSDKLVELIKKNFFDSFLNIILSKSYLMQEQSLSEVEALEKIEFIYKQFNYILKKDLYKITRNNGKYYFVKEDDDLEFIGKGGFANVYLEKSTGLVVKKLKDEYIIDSGIRSRFKREYSIMQSLQDVDGVIKVYSFDEGNYSYKMEYAEITLEKYIKSNDLSDEVRINFIFQILDIMTEIHKRDIIHRDISSNNIFVKSGMVKIADFGLGKDLNISNSHHTLHTNAVGQYLYCAPEQFTSLKDSDKKSDVYSLGKIINFIMTNNASNSHHIYRNITEKATSINAISRYDDAGQLAIYFKKTVSYVQSRENEIHVNDKIKKRLFDDEVENYIYNLSPEKLSLNILNNTSEFKDALLSFMKLNDEHAFYIIESIDKSYKNICGKTFSNYDPFALFAYNVLKNRFEYIVHEKAAEILRFVAKDVNRFKSQDLIKDIKSCGIEPLIENILDS